MDKEQFQILRYLDEPKRILGLTLDDCIIGGFTIFFVVFTSSKITMFLIGVSVKLVMKQLRKGNPPSHLLLLMYWYLPYSVTKYFLAELPPSFQRYWISQEKRIDEICS